MNRIYIEKSEAKFFKYFCRKVISFFGGFSNDDFPSPLAGGEKRVARSGVVRLEVAGAPMVSRSVQDVVAVSGRDVSLEAEFCSDPEPLRNTWQWGSIVLPTGNELGGKYRAELVQHPQV